MTQLFVRGLFDSANALVSNIQTAVELNPEQGEELVKARIAAKEVTARLQRVLKAMSTDKEEKNEDTNAG